MAVEVLERVFKPQPTSRIEFQLPQLNLQLPDLNRPFRKVAYTTIGVLTTLGVITGWGSADTPKVFGDGVREFDLTGTLDCGAKSSRRCNIPHWEQDPMVGVWTRDLSGNPERAAVRIGWPKVKRDFVALTDLRQDDFVWFRVFQEPDNTFRAVGVVEHHGDGLDNTGLSNGSRRIPEKGKEEKKRT